jgi:hypothetical protein
MNRIRCATLGPTAVAAAALLALAGCSSSGTKTASLASGSPMASASGSSVSMSDPSTVLGQWFKDVIGQNYQAACLLAVAPPDGVVPTTQAQDSAEATGAPIAPTASYCSANLTKPGPIGISMKDDLAKVERPNYLPVTGSISEITVNVAPVTPTGDSAKIDGKQITVNGQRLDRIVAANNKVPASQVDLSYQMVRIGGSWYIRNDNLDIGPDTGNGSSGSPVATAAP